MNSPVVTPMNSPVTPMNFPVGANWRHEFLDHGSCGNLCLDTDLSKKVYFSTKTPANTPCVRQPDWSHIQSISDIPSISEIRARCEEVSTPQTRAWQISPRRTSF